MAATLKDYAQWYADFGWHILPLNERTKEPAVIPADGYIHAYQSARPDASIWQSVPYNIGLAVKASGIVVADGDIKNGFHLDALTDWYGDSILDTVSATSGSGGKHLLYLAPDGVEVRKSAGVNRYGRPGPLGMGVDVISLGYIVLPPSIHPNGNRYRWDEGHAPWDRPIAPLPAAMLAALQKPRYEDKSITPSAYDPAFIDKLPARPQWLIDEASIGAVGGGRHLALFPFACKAIRQCPREQDARELVEMFGRNCSPSLDRAEIEQIWRDAARANHFTPPNPKQRRWVADSSEPCF